MLFACAEHKLVPLTVCATHPPPQTQVKLLLAAGGAGLMGLAMLVALTWLA